MLVWRVEVFGSFKTGLYLPTSDIDVIAKARVPIIKFIEKRSGVAFDIREGHGESSCFQLHSFPEWWGDRPRGSKGLGRGGGRTGRGGGRVGSGRGRGYGAPSIRANKIGGAGTLSWQPAIRAGGACGTPRSPPTS
ncbi:hypothetical protein IFM89_000256 [Coptis chinensis]|uniref:Polymerase nucleotidyl transferase domain-containing protein n=1 Tax=Coptis chinensis TaxID=261450 RepID=A0A835IFR5_9MAGN|nr:hypothetical protein IFM89_000256 [Coptis chinensis]